MPARATAFRPPIVRRQSEEVRVLAGLARFAGAGYIAFPVIFGRQIWALREFGAITAIAVLMLILAPGIALRASAAVRGGYRWVPLLSILCLLGFVAGVGIWVAAVHAGASAPPAIWLIGVGSLPALALAQWRSIGEGLAALAGCQVLAAYTIDLAERLGPASMAVDAVFTVVFVSVFVVLTHQVVVAGRVIDESAEAVIGEATETARRLEFARVNALIHDRVLATLLAVEPGPADDRLAAQAREALDELAALESGATAESFSGDELLAQLRTAVRLWDGDVPILVHSAACADAAECRYPRQVCSALCAAVGEAVRNSLRHAGCGAECLVLVHLQPHALRLTVMDDGPGFDPDAVPADRLGLQYSIRGRLEALAGGSVHIDSEPGAGTAVHLDWERVP